MNCWRQIKVYSILQLKRASMMLEMLIGYLKTRPVIHLWISKRNFHKKTDTKRWFLLGFYQFAGGFNNSIFVFFPVAVLHVYIDIGLHAKFDMFLFGIEHWGGSWKSYGPAIGKLRGERQPTASSCFISYNGNIWCILHYTYKLVCRTVTSSVGKNNHRLLVSHPPVVTINIFRIQSRKIIMPRSYFMRDVANKLALVEKRLVIRSTLVRLPPPLFLTSIISPWQIAILFNISLRFPWPTSFEKLP